MGFKFENLRVWQFAMDYGERINELSMSFPEREKFNLSSQILRASDSVALNIAEGSIGQSNPEFKKSLGYAIRSLAETVTCLYKAKRREYLTEQKFNDLYKDAFQLMNQLIALRNSII